MTPRHDRITRRVVERLLAHLVDTAAAVNAHLVGAILGRAPRDLAESFDPVVEAGIVPTDLGQRLRLSAGMRNVIVHADGDLDLERVARAVPSAQADFTTYVKAVAAYLRTRSPIAGRRVTANRLPADTL